GLHFFLEGFHLGLDGRRPLRMVSLSLVQYRLRPVDGSLPALTVLPSGGFCLCAFALAAALLLFVGEGGFPLRSCVDGIRPKLGLLAVARLAVGFLRGFTADKIGG